MHDLCSFFATADVAAAAENHYYLIMRFLIPGLALIPALLAWKLRKRARYPNLPYAVRISATLGLLAIVAILNVYLLWELNVPHAPDPASSAADQYWFKRHRDEGAIFGSLVGTASAAYCIYCFWRTPVGRGSGE